jgi:hypothetical protein
VSGVGRRHRPPGCVGCGTGGEPKEYVTHTFEIRIKGEVTSAKERDLQAGHSLREAVGRMAPPDTGPIVFKTVTVLKFDEV